MTEINNLILKLVMENKSLKEICDATNLSSKQIINRLKTIEQYGYQIEKEYYYSGDIKYNISKNVNEDEKPALIFNQDNKNFRAMLISDLHLASKFENVKALNLIYDYCKKNGINIIINAGDIIQGHIGQNRINIFDYEEQIKHLLKVYPYDIDILNFLVMGNHDINLLNESGINLTQVLKYRRHDIIPLGFKQAKLDIGNDTITMHHHIDNFQNSNNFDFSNFMVRVIGHSHKMSITYDNNSFNIHVPTLSNIFFNSDDFLPGACELNIKLEYNYFSNITLHHLLINDKIHKINTIKYPVLFNKTQISQQQSKADKQKTNRMSQIDKFNARYKK